jgi:hypothetical protein
MQFCTLIRHCGDGFIIQFQPQTKAGWWNDIAMLPSDRFKPKMNTSLRVRASIFFWSDRMCDTTIDVDSRYGAGHCRNKISGLWARGKATSVCNPIDAALIEQTLKTQNGFYFVAHPNPKMQPQISLFYEGFTSIIAWAGTRTLW